MAVTTTNRRFFDAAMEILAESGYGGLKLAPLCRRVGVTTGSFYHAFEGWPRFTAQLLEHWFEERTVRIREAAGAVVEPEAQVELLLRSGLALPHASEAAIRVWAGIDPQVRALQDEVDRIRLGTVAQAFRGVVGDAAVAERLARAALYAVVGYEQAGAARDPEALEAGLLLLVDEARRIAGRDRAGQG